MISAEADLEHHRPVWEALSTLFLDTDISLARPWRVKVLAASPYSLEELETILVDEVYPACKWNLFGVAGERAGFDQQWLEVKILRRLRSPFRSLHSLNLGRLTVHLSFEWRRTKRCHQARTRSRLIRCGDLAKLGAPVAAWPGESAHWQCRVS